MGRLGPLAAAVVAAVAVADGAVVHRVAPSVLARWASTAATIGSRPWRLVTATFLTDGPHMTVTVCAGLLVSLAFAERRLGARPALVAGVAGSLVGTLVCDLVLLAGAGLHIPAAETAATRPDFGASAISAGAAGAVARTLPLPAAAVVAFLTLNGLVVNHTLADWEHLAAFLTAWALLASSGCTPRSSPRRFWQRSVR